jgi:hypothetical protein
MPTDEPDDYYAAIGVDAGANSVTIRKALVREQRIWGVRQNAHDRAASHEAERRVQLLAEIGDVLLDPKRKATYDKRQVQPSDQKPVIDDQERFQETQRQELERRREDARPKLRAELRVAARQAPQVRVSLPESKATSAITDNPNASAIVIGMLALAIWTVGGALALALYWAAVRSGLTSPWQAVGIASMLSGIITALATASPASPHRSVQRYRAVIAYAPAAVIGTSFGAWLGGWRVESETAHIGAAVFGALAIGLAFLLVRKADAPRASAALFESISVGLGAGFGWYIGERILGLLPYEAWLVTPMVCALALAAGALVWRNRSAQGFGHSTLSTRLTALDR